MSRFIHFISIGINNDLDNLEAYTREISDTLDKLTHEFLNEVEQKAKLMSPDVQERWYDHTEDRHWELTEVFPDIHRNSLFITIYSCLESTLLELCKTLERESPKPIKRGDLLGRGVILYQTYLKKVQGINFPDQSEEWDRILTYQKIRNFLIHNDAYLDDSKNANAVKVFASENPELLSVNKRSNKITLTNDCNLDLISDVRSFFKELFKQIS